MLRANRAIASSSIRSGFGTATPFHYDADANIGHAFGIFMANFGTLRTSCLGAG